MEHHCSVLLAASLLFASSLWASAAMRSAGTDADHRALMQFQSLITNDPHGALASWGGNASAVTGPCGWHGVTCGARGRRRGRVTALDLHGFGLAGSITPSALAGLTYLRRLNLAENSLTGGVPSRLPLSLKLLNLSYNALGGPVPPALGSLHRLQNLNLDSNDLTGTIPASLGNLTSITALSLSINNLVGPIPDSFGNLQSLTGLYLNFNMLQGSIPTAVFNLSSLQYLILQDNNLNGTLPSDGKLPSLRVLSVDSNHLHGAIPASLCNASKMEVIQMVNNSFSGVIPDCFGALNNLWAVVLDVNQLEANVDADWGFMDSLTNCSSLQFIGLGGNKLRGVLPGSIANLSTTMKSLSMWGNMVSGEIPQEIGNLVNLNTIQMGFNNLTGTIPASLGKLHKLSNLYLNDNRLSGQIPPTIGNLTVLLILALDNNTLTGPIPSSLGSFPLTRLTLDNNRLTGPIPKEVLLISTLVYASFQGNMLTGSLALEVGHMINLQVLDVSKNRLTGEIPISLGDCQVLEYCVLKGNVFQGKIPDTIGQMRGLLGLDLSGNNLSGHIPDYLGTMKGLEELDLSYNSFDGEVPKRGIFLNASAFSVEGNTALCGGIDELKLPPCSNHGSTTDKRSRKVIMTISLATGILSIALLLALFVFYYRRRNQRRKLRKEEHTMPNINDQHVRVSYINLANVTNGFSSENLVGVGSFGSVYKGTMMINDQEVVVAVKVLNLQQRGASQSFIAECETLRCARHRNLVKILTVCSSIESGGLDFKALVFEFLPNGNLDQWLHTWEHGIHMGLDLAQRIDIAIDIASALEYLHNYRPSPIVHCDLKPSNILLDNDTVAHVGDFGLARFVHQDRTSLPDISSSWATRRGTIGYAAPEYGLGNEVSIHGDIYSFGVLLLEIFTGKRPTDSSFVDDLSLHSYVQVALQDQQVASVVDQRLLPVQDQESEGRTSSSSSTTETMLSCVTSVLQIGILCSKEAPTDRLLIGDALRELQGVKDKYSRTHN